MTLHLMGPEMTTLPIMSPTSTEPRDMGKRENVTMTSKGMSLRTNLCLEKFLGSNENPAC